MSVVAKLHTKGDQPRFDRGREGMEAVVCESAAERGTNGAPALATLPHYASPVGGPMGAGQAAAAAPTRRGGPVRGNCYGGIRTIDDLRLRTIDGDGGCWLWKGALSSSGQPSLWLHGGHKFSAGGAIKFLLTGHKPTRGLVWAPKCRNPLCMNPAHRIEMTVLEHRRWSRSDRTLAQRIVYATLKQRASRIDWDVVHAIRASNQTHEQLAEKHGLSISMISKIRRGKCWRDPMKMALDQKSIVIEGDGDPHAPRRLNTKGKRA